MLHKPLRLGVAALAGVALVAVGPTPPAHAVAAPAPDTLAAATVAVQRTATTAALAIRVVFGQTSWGLGLARCGRGDAYLTGGVVVRSPTGAVRAPAAIWPGDIVTVSCGRTVSPAAGPTAPAGRWVAPVVGALQCVSKWGDPREWKWKWVNGKKVKVVTRWHKGVDLGRAYGTPIRAVAAGTIRMVRYSVNPYTGKGAGWYVMVDHGGGTQTVSMHQRGRPPVSVGQRVRQGQTIGYVGSSGATSPHLHFEVHRGPWTSFWTQVNPGPQMRAHGLQTVSCG